MNQKKSTQTLKSILQTLTSVFLNWLNLFWQIIRGFVLFIKKKITKFKRQLRQTKVNNHKINTPFSLQERGQFGNIKKQRPTLYQYLKLFTPKFRFKSWKWKRFILSMTMTFILTLQFTGINWWQLPQPAHAAASLSIEPLTWDFVGLDSNKPDAPDNQGPKDYMVGSRVCNMGDEPVRDVTVQYHNDGVDNGYTYINIATDTLYLDYLPPNLNTIPGTIATIPGGYTFETGGIPNATKYEINYTPTNCADFYINFDVDRNTDAWHTTQKYYMEATAKSSAGALVGPVRTPQPRQIYIEQLISQARNEVRSFGCSVAGGAFQQYTVNVAVGDVMICTAVGHTSTAYPQLSFTANFPNVIFQILDVNTSYSNPIGGKNSAVYADGCGWVQDPTSPDYHRSPTNCAGAGWPGQYTDNSGGEGTGLDVVTNYTVKVLSKPTGSTVEVSNIVLDFSGGSFHYNSDYGTDFCGTTDNTNCIIINFEEENSDLSIIKSHDGNFILGANQYTMTITDDNNSVPAKDIKFYDTLPVGYTFNTADLIANDGVGQDGTKWYCTITDPSAFGGQDRSVVCNYTNGTFLTKTDDFFDHTDPQTLIFNVIVASPPASTNSTNTACVKASNDLNTANNCDPDPTTLIFGPNIELTKDDSSTGSIEPRTAKTNETFVAGGTQTYRFQVAKTTDAYNVNGPLTLVDTLPTGVTYVSNNGNDGWSCSANGQIVTCTRATGLTGLTTDTTSKTTFAMTVAVSLNAVDMDSGTAGVQVINTATVTSGSLDVNPNDNTDTQKNTVTIPAPDLTIDKTDNSLPFIFNNTTPVNSVYIFTIANKSTAGTITTTGPLVFQDILPSHLNLVSAGNAPGSTGWTCTPSGATTAPTPPTAIPLAAPTYNDPVGSVGVTVNCTNPNPLPPGASTQIRLVINPNFNPPGNGANYNIGNRATVTTQGETNFDFGDDPANGSGDTNNICKARNPVITTANCDEEITNIIDSANSIDVASTKIVRDTAPPATYPTTPVPPTSISTIAPGSTIYYSILLNTTAIGQGATNITGTGTFTDTIPAGITGISATCTVSGNGGSGGGSNLCCTPSISGNTITCNGYSLRKGGTKGLDDQLRINVVGTVNSTFAGNLVNTAIVGLSAGLDEDPTNNISTVVTYVPGADLSITKNAFSNFTVGTDSIYTLTVKNESPSTAPNNFSTTGLITVRDKLPTQLDFVSAAGSGWFCNYDNTTRVVTCTTTQVLAPQATSVINLTVKPNLAGSVTNAASLQYGGDPLDDDENGFYVGGGNSVTDDVNGNGMFDTGDDPNSNDFDAKTTTVIAPNVDLNITKTAQTAFPLGQQATYRINVANHNAVGATAAIAPITVTDQLPQGVNFVYASTVTGSPWVCTSTTNALPDNNNNGIVDAGDGDFNPGPPITPINDGFETVSCTRYTNIAPNETATFDLNVLVTASANTAAPITNNVRVTSSSDICKDFTNGNCTDTVTPVDTNPANDTNSQPNDNKTTLNVNVTPASDLTIYKKAITQTSQINPPQFLVDNTGQFEITVVNNGPSTYTGLITFTDALNNNFTFSSGSGGGFICENSGQNVTCETKSPITSPPTPTPITLNPGASAVVKINVTVANTPTAAITDTGADQAGDNISNLAKITSPVTTPIIPNSSNTDMNNDSGTEIVDIEPFVADLVLQKDDGDGEYALTPSTHNGVGALFDEPLLTQNRQYFSTSNTAPPGGGSWKGAYTLEVTNKGPAIAKYPVKITDTLPTGLTFSSANGVGWTCGAVLQVVTCTYDIATDKNGDLTIDNNDDFLRSGENTGVQIIVNVDHALVTGDPDNDGAIGRVTNSATITSGTTDSNNSNNTNSEITIIREAADLSVTKTDSADPISLGASFTYTVTIHNDTPGYTGDIVGPIYATDYLPTGVVYDGSNTTAGTTVDITSSNTGTASCTWRLVTSGGNYVSFVCDDGTFGGTYPNLANLSTSSFTFKVKVNDPTVQSIEKNLVRVGASIDEPDNPDQVICDRTDPPFIAPYSRINVPLGRTNNCSIEPTTITGAKNADLVIIKQAGANNNDNPPAESLNNEDPFTYTFTVSNNGADDAQQVLLKDVFPDGVIPVDANAGTPGIQITYTINAGHTTSTTPYDSDLTTPAIEPTIVTRTCSYNEGANTFSCKLYTVSSTEKTGGTGPIIITLNMKVNTASGTPSNEATLESSTSDNTQNNNCTANSFTNTAITNCDLELIQVGTVTATLDFGDAPNIYKTTSASGGPSHTPSTNLLMGTNATDTESDAPATLDGTGDDTTGTDDEDGVTFGPLVATVNAYSVKVKVTNTTGSNAYLAGWIDFNQNSTFEAGEGVVYDFDPSTAGIQPIPTGTNGSNITLNWTGLSGITTGNTYARFRISDQTLATTDFEGAKGIGEVEDYPLTIIPVGAYKSVQLTTDANSNNQIDPGDKVTWTIKYINTGTVDISDFNVSDTIDTAELTYVTGTLAIATNTAQSVPAGNVPTVNTNYDGTNTHPNFFDSPVLFKAGGLITITFQTEVKAGVSVTKYNQATGTDPASTKTDNVDNTTTGLPAGVSVTMGSIAQTQTAAIEPTTITLGAEKPNIILLKRITGVYRQNTPVVTNQLQPFSLFHENGADPNDDPAEWKNNKFPAFNADGIYLGDTPTNPENNAYLRGAIDGGLVESDDEIEFTIYFVNKGGANATNVTLCDLVPANLDFVANAYGSGKGIAVSFDATKLNLEPNLFYSNANGDDEGTFFAPGVDTTATTPKCPFDNDGSAPPPLGADDLADNTDGVVAVDLGTVPYAIPWNDPNPKYDSYGFIRFRAKVK